MKQYPVGVVQRQLGLIWVASFAAVVGVLIAALTGGGAPSIVLIAALVVVPAAVTLYFRLGPRRPHGRQGAVSPERVATSRRPEHHPSEADRYALAALCRALDSRQLDWLRTNDFVTPWLDRGARPAIELASAVAALGKVPFETEIQGALLHLSDAVAAFVDFYDRNTFADPLLLGDEWRFFEWDDRGPAGELVPYEDLWGGRAIRLHGLAARLAESYESLTAVTAPRVAVSRRTADVLIEK